jgi:hypothetical protein
VASIHQSLFLSLIYSLGEKLLKSTNISKHIMKCHSAFEMDIFILVDQIIRLGRLMVERIIQVGSKRINLTCSSLKR